MLQYIGIPDTAPITDTLILAYMDKLARTGAAGGTTKQHRQTARRFEQYLAGVGATATTAEAWQVEDFFDTLNDLEVSTRHGHKKRMQAWYRYALRRGAVSSDPTADVHLPKIREGEPEIVDNADLRRYLDAVRDDQQWAQFHLLAYTGMRRQECIDLLWEDVDFLGSTITVKHGKGDKRRQVPIHPVLGEALLQVQNVGWAPVIRPRRSARRIGNETWDSILNAYVHGEHTAHAFRRTVASSLALNGVADPLIDEIMGWAKRSVGRRYYIRVAKPELQRAILKLYVDDPL